MKFPFHDRREHLRALGLGAAAYFLPSLPKAEAAVPPRRLLLLLTQHANPYPEWRMRLPGLSESAAWEIDLATLARDAWSRVYAPLYDFRRKLLVFDTLSNPVGMEVGGNGGGHFNGPKTLLTGATAARGSDPKQSGGPSIDQLVA